MSPELSQVQSSNLLMINSAGGGKYLSSMIISNNIE